MVILDIFLLFTTNRMGHVSYLFIRFSWTEFPISCHCLVTFSCNVLSLYADSHFLPSVDNLRELLNQQWSIETTSFSYSTTLQGCTNCGSLAAGLRGNGERMRKWRGNGERMRKWRGNGERMRKWREIHSQDFLILCLFPPSLSISYIKNCHILSQNVKYGTFVANVTKNLTYVLWENDSWSNLLWESSANCEGLGRTMKDPGFHKIGQKTNTTLYPPMEDLLQLYFTMLHCFLVRPVAKIWFWSWSLLAFSKRFTARRGPGK